MNTWGLVHVRVELVEGLMLESYSPGLYRLHLAIHVSLATGETCAESL